MASKLIWLGGCAILLMAAARPAAAQTMIEVATPFNSISDDSFERMGVGFGFSLQGGQGPGSRVVGLLPNGQLNPNGDLVFGQNSVASALPQAGGFDPNAQATFGFGVLSGGNQFNVGLFMGKGSERSISSVTPSVVMHNGQTASIFSGQLQPFVTGITPIIGDGWGGLPGGAFGWGAGGDGEYWDTGRSSGAGGAAPAAGPPPTRSTATEGAASVEELRRQRQQRLAGEAQARLAGIDEFLAKARQFVEAKRYGAARVNLQRAIRLIGDDPALAEMRAEAERLLSQIKDK